jgi:hypothetical protein
MVRLRGKHVHAGIRESIQLAAAAGGDDDHERRIDMHAAHAPPFSDRR